MTITVISATGNVGTLVARGLLAEGQRMRALVRDPGKARDRLSPDYRLEIITGDLGTPANLEAHSGVPTPPTPRWDRSAWRGTSRASRSWQPGAPPCRSSSGCPC